jgi:hypothetical protein
MALIRLGGIAIDARGSVGGIVFSRNASGNYVRARITPVNPQSARQDAIRAIWAEVSQKWFSLLTDAQRSEWAVYAANVPTTNKLGQVINLSGFNMFQKSNVAAANAGLPVLDDGPAIFTLPGEDTSFAVAISEASQELSVTFDDTRDWVDEDDSAMIIQMGIPKNDSINFFDGPYRHAGVILGDGTTAPTTPATITVPFPVVANQKVWTRGLIIKNDGRMSDWFRVDSIAGA